MTDNGDELSDNETFNGTSTNITTGGQPELYVQVAACIMYTTIVVVAVGGNSIVAYIILSNRHMRTVTNMFLLNLAISDFLMATLCIPMTFISNVVLAMWPFGPMMCPIVLFAQTVVVFLSSLTLVAISLDRLVAVVKPLRRRLTMKKVLIILASIWTIAICICLPVAIVSQVHYPFGKPICSEMWSDEAQRIGYSISIMVIQYFVPLSIFIFTYIWIGIIVWIKKPPGESDEKRDRRMASSKRRMVKMMITVVAIYALCWLPTHLLTIIGDATDGGIYDVPGMPLAWVFFHWLAMSSSCYNPIIYIWMNAKFRQGFKKILSCLPCVHYDEESAVIVNYNSQSTVRHRTYRSVSNGQNARTAVTSLSNADLMENAKKKDLMVKSMYRNEDTQSPKKLIVSTSNDELDHY